MQAGDEEGSPVAVIGRINVGGRMSEEELDNLDIAPGAGNVEGSAKVIWLDILLSEIRILQELQNSRDLAVQHSKPQLVLQGCTRKKKRENKRRKRAQD